MVDHEGREAGGLRPRERSTPGNVHAHDHQARRSEKVPGARIDQGLQVRARAGGEHSHVHGAASRNSTGASGPGAGATLPISKTRSPAASRSPRASATRPAGTQTTMPMPMLKVRRISRADTRPARARISITTGTGQVPP